MKNTSVKDTSVKGTSTKVVAVLFAPSDDMQSLEWARRTAGDDIKVLKRDEEDDWTLTRVLEAIKDACAEAGAQAAVFAYSDCPFLDDELTSKLIESHFKYCAQYTFADGYPYGFAPEVIDAGTAGILAELSKAAQSELGNKKMSRQAIWDLIKTDINSFEVETVIAPKDYRLWRLAFHNGDKRCRMACEALKTLTGTAPRYAAMSVDEKCQAAIKDIHVVRTVPAFYEVRIKGQNREAGLLTEMPLEKFVILAKQMKELSDTAVVSLNSGVSAAGDPAAHHDFVKVVETAARFGLDVLVETDGEGVTEEKALQCLEIQEKYGAKVMWIVKTAGGTAGEDVIILLAKYFHEDVYPQMVRTKETESALETFFRKWSAKDSPTGGKVLIQKYCSYCGKLPDEKPCDLSPLERNPCWHLRRDMVILADGTVPVCFAREKALEEKTPVSKNNVLGNAFTDGIAVLWDKMEEAAKKDLDTGVLDTGVFNGEKDELCRKCDEYYTFNF